MFVARRDAVPLFPAPEWREVYDHLKAARDHLKAAEDLLHRKRRRTPRITETWHWLDDVCRALKLLP